ncbi:MAG TPA: translesion DNA synthesis-associated protein ImuA [Usitatibacter sp.]|nr:translesion DNA synthesis-associated protein ImuA [Usitatibacter sp.]
MKASVAELVRLPGVWRGGELEQSQLPSIATGHASLDAQLPGGGWPTGSLTEVLHDSAGIGEITFLASVLARAAGEDRLIAWINAPHLPYAPALAQAGIPLARCLVVRPSHREDALWAAEQALKSGACGAVLFWLDGSLRQRGREKPNEYASLRRLQMAAEAGRAIAIHFRSTAAERLSTPAHLRVVLQREEGMLGVRIPKRRGPPLATPLRIRAGYSPRRAPSPAAGLQPSTVSVPARARAFQLVGR